ncbi:MAG: aldehyde oxidase [Spartobacteria bacterium]|nr:aldehyde oxidase [Spartobacteria bacterium]
MKVKDYKVVNHSVRKVDGRQLVTGAKAYVADFKPADALYVKMLWSPHAHAVIKSIDVTQAEAVPGVHCVLCCENTPRNIHCTAGQGFPEPSPYDTCMFDHKVRFVGDRVAAVIAESPQIALDAIKKIDVKYAVLEPVLSIDKAMADDAPRIHDEADAYVPIPIPYEPENNLVAKVSMSAGDVAAGLAESDAVLDYTYNTPYAQHCPIEPYVSMAHIDPHGRIIILTSTQVPFHCRRIVARTLGIPEGKIRVVKPRIGGGFGCKQEMLLEDVVAMAALRTGRHVIWEFTREEMFRTGRTRHPIRLHIQTGVKKDGTVKAYNMEVINNTGAYGGHGLTVASCCGSKALPLYHCDNVAFDAKVFYTNLPVGGAYRGFGATQAFFAAETQFDEMAEVIGMDPLVFRRMNHIQSGETHPVFAALGEGKEGTPMTIGSIALDDCIDQGAEAIGWDKRVPHTEKSGRYRKGIGMCCLMQGSSVPEIDMGAASIKMNDDGSFNLLIGATDLGTGSDTALGQIAAEELGVSIEKMIVYSSDTDLTPFDVGAYACSTTYLSGEAVRKAAVKVRQQIMDVAAEMLHVSADELTLANEQVTAKNGETVSYREIAAYSLYQNNQFQIMANASHVTHKSPPPFAAHFVEIEVDTWTGKIKVLNYVAACDCGVAINPLMAEGQVEGALLNGISYALTEQYIFDTKGKMTNPSFQNYHIWSMADKPSMKTILCQSFEETGPWGAKSIGEININGPAPAINNALFNAVGIRLRSFPFLPERVFNALQKKS